MPINDLRCPNGHFEGDAAYRGEVPPCPKCGAERHVTWEMGKAPGVHTFRPVTIFGERYDSKEDLDRERAKVAANLKCPIGDIQVDEPKKRSERADFHRHRAWERRKKAGIDEQQRKEIKTERKKYKASQPTTGRRANKAA